MRALLPTLFMTLTLAACGKTEVKAPVDYPLSGTLSGAWGSSPRLRLALVGSGIPNPVTTNSAIGQNVVPLGAGSYSFGFELPTPPLPNIAGVYQVVAFDDANNDAQLNLGEPFARNRQWLVYSPVGGTVGPVNLPDFLGGAEALPEMTVGRGWNLLDRAQPLSPTNPRPVTRLTGYDISRS